MREHLRTPGQPSPCRPWFRALRKTLTDEWHRPSWGVILSRVSHLVVFSGMGRSVLDENQEGRLRLGLGLACGRRLSTGSLSREIPSKRNGSRSADRGGSSGEWGAYSLDHPPRNEAKPAGRRRAKRTQTGPVGVAPNEAKRLAGKAPSEPKPAFGACAKRIQTDEPGEPGGIGWATACLGRCIG